MSLHHKLIRRAFALGLKSRYLGEMLEVDYWRRVDVNDHRIDPNCPLQERIVKLLPQKNDIVVIDVGAGMVSTVGKKYQNKNITLIPIDPLADKYRSVLIEKKIPPQFWSRNIPIEAFETGYADIVFARNSIDHSQNPVKEITEIMRVGRKVLMEHLINTAETENYRGLHQWNLEPHPNGLRVWNRKEQTIIPNVQNEIIKIDGREWLISKI